MIGFVPEEVKNYLNINQVGIGELFGLLYIIFEFLSVLKNLYLCKIPIPKKIKSILERVLSDFTEEVKVVDNGKETSKKDR